ncbi:PAS domain-containing protein [Roseiconus lacunae]|uniref:PAS domain-containing protein n=1 Tax=Roseiconus lacunae TaxID=2605694 RepID=UPI001E589107|nr:PAS domain-containing protein [Roseiconus lacunae]MCD0459682.1 PAS domain-containing protein [Roseiconus lacunae]
MTSSNSTDHQLFDFRYNKECRWVHRFMAKLMLVQWMVGILFAFFWSPYTWIGSTSYVHLHVWAAVFAGGALSSFAALWVATFPNATHSRHVIAVSQMMWSALLIHLSGGRIETHFHVFASLAILSSYRDWRVLVTATATVAIDHWVRGVFYPLSVFGVTAESSFRWLEHVAWVLFEVSFLIPCCHRLRREFKELCDRQGEIERSKRSVDQQVNERTQALIQTNHLLLHKTDEAEMLAMVARYTDNAVAITDAEGRIKWVNEGYTRITGYLPEDVIEEDVLQFQQCEETDAAAVNKMRQALRTGSACNLELQNRRKNGDAYWLATEIRPTKNKDNGSPRFIVINSDVSERKAVELSLAEAEQQLRSILDNVPGAFYRRHLGQDDKSVFMSRWIETITGYPAEEFIVPETPDPDFLLSKRSHLDFVHPDDNERVNKTFQDAINDRSDFSIEYRITDKNDHVRWVWERGTCSEQSDSGAIVDGTLFDITDRIEAEQENLKLQQDLLDASRQAGMAEIATGVLHNVGNILNSVNVSATQIQKQLDSSPLRNLEKISGLIDEYRQTFPAFVKDDRRGQKVPEYIRHVTDALQGERQTVRDEVNDLVSNIEHIKAIISVQQTMAKSSGLMQSLEIRDLLNDSISANKASLQSHRINLSQSIDDDVPTIVSDKHRILQILVNLIKNAVDALRDSNVQSPKISVIAKKEADHVSMRVADNGVGIRQDRLDQIFQHGFTTKKGGFGFGLHSSANAAKELGGRLTVASEGEGCGASFELTIPICPKKETRPSGENESVAQTS